MADALSRRDEDKSENECATFALNKSNKGIIARLRIKVDSDAKLADLRDRIIRDEEIKHQPGKFVTG